MSKNELLHISTLALRQRKSHLLRSFNLLPNLLHASFLERFLKCGRSNCHCHQGDKHGPFFYLSRCLPERQMQTLLLKGEDQILQGQQGVDAYHQLLQNLDQISVVNWELLRRGEALDSDP